MCLRPKKILLFVRGHFWYSSCTICLVNYTILDAYKIRLHGRYNRGHVKKPHESIPSSPLTPPHPNKLHYIRSQPIQSVHMNPGSTNHIIGLAFGTNPEDGPKRDQVKQTASRQRKLVCHQLRSWNQWFSAINKLLITEPHKKKFNKRFRFLKSIVCQGGHHDFSSRVPKKNLATPLVITTIHGTSFHGLKCHHQGSERSQCTLSKFDLSHRLITEL